MNVMANATPASSAFSHEVWARMAWVIIDLAQRANLSMSALFEGLPYDAARLRRMRRISWDDYATICERVHTLIGSDDDLDELVESTYHVVLPELRRLGRVVIEPKPFVRFINDVIDPLWNHAADFWSEDLGPDRVRLITRLRPGARGCWTVFRGSVGAWRGCTRHLDLPPSEVTHYEIGPDYGIYELRLPRSRTLVSRAFRASRTLGRSALARLIMGADEDGKIIRVSVGSGDVLSERLDNVTIEWGLTRRQIAVLNLVVRGEANKEIAQALACAENTVELHVTQLLRKANVPSRTRLIARFWSDQ
jgi:DNA-binding CsgD family transcriptional regulator